MTAQALIGILERLDRIEQHLGLVPEPPPALELGPPPAVADPRQQPPAPVALWVRRTEDLLRVVPADFIGMHFNRIPVSEGRESPLPTYPVDTVRSHDYDPAHGRSGPQLRQVFPGAERTDATALRAWAERHATKRLIWTMGGTPRWAATNEEPGPWGSPGAASPPAVEGLAARVVAVALELGIDAIEIWNEPDPDIPAGSKYDRWWSGTMEELARWAGWLQRALDAAGARDRIMLVGPAFTDLQGYSSGEGKIHRFAEAARKQGVLLDAFTWHWYDYQGNVETTAIRFAEDCARIRTAVAEAFGPMPVWITELGAWQWGGASQVQQSRALWRWLAIAAASGMDLACLYGHEFDTIGRPIEGGPTADAIAMAHRELVGRSIRQCAVLETGEVWVDAQ